MFIVEPKKENIEVDIKECQLSLKEKLGIFLRNYEIGQFNETLKLTKFVAIDEFAESLILRHDKNFNTDQDYHFTINMKPSTQEELKEFLTKHKKFILDFIVSNNYFPGSHIYQLYLQYIPQELNEIEKSILLDGYIIMLTDLKGQNYSNDKRKRLEKKLNINQD